MNGNVIYLPAQKADSGQLAKLHSNNITGGFLSSLGNEFLSLLYSTIICSDHSFCFIAKKDGEIIGFVSATSNIKRLYFDFALSNFASALLLLAKILRPSVIKPLLETLSYPARKKIKGVPSPELLSISVTKDFRGQGISNKLFDLAVDGFKKRNISKFKIAVGSNLLQAQRFYEKMGCKYISEIEVHKGEKSKVYVYDIKINENTSIKS